MISSRVEQLINKQLKDSALAQRYQVLGVSNGVEILHNQNTSEKKAMMHISAIVEQNSIKYEAIFIPISQETQYKIKRVPFKHCNNLTQLDMQKGKNIQKIQIDIKPSPLGSSILAIKISLIKKNALNNRDTISIIAIDEDNDIMSPSFKEIDVNRVVCQDKIINDFKWHPQSQVSLQVLGNEHFEVWDISEQNFYSPTQGIKLKLLKSYLQIPNQIKFTSFFNPSTFTLPQKQNDINFQKYTLYLLTNIGEIYSIFPYYPAGSIFSEQQRQQIYRARFGYQHPQQTNKLKIFFNYCKTQQIVQDEGQQVNYFRPKNKKKNKYQVMKSPILQISQYNCHTIVKAHPRSGEHFDHIRDGKKDIYEIRKKYVQQIRENNLIVVDITPNCSLFFTARFYRKSNQTKICIEMSATDSQNDQYNIYPITQISTDIPAPVKILHAENQNIIKNSNILFFQQANTIFKLDFTSAVKFIQKNDLQYLQKNNAFPLQVLFKVGKKQSIVSMLMEYEEGNLYIIRSDGEDIRFQAIVIKLLGMMEEAEKIRHFSSILTKRLEEMKKYILEKEFNGSVNPKISQFQLGSNEIKKYQSQGVQRFKKDYEKHCANLKNIVDQSMSKLKQTYETMKGKNNNFKQLKKKKQKLNNLLQKMQNNNTTIQKILFKTQKKPSQQPKDYQLRQFCEKSQRLYNMLEKASSFTLDLQEQSKKCMQEEADMLLFRLKQMKEQLQQTKKGKKQLKMKK